MESVIPHVPDHVIILIVGELSLITTTHQVWLRPDRRSLDEDDVPAPACTPCRCIVNPQRLAAHTVADKAFFPGTVFQFLSVGFHMHERPHPDRSKVSEIGVLAVKSLIRRLISQCCVWSPVAQLDRSLHQLSPEKVWQTRISKQAAYNASNSPSCTLIGSDLLGCTWRSKL